MGISLNPATILSGQGIDVSSVVQQIIRAESGPLNVWQGQQSTIATQNGVLQGINDNLVNLQIAVAALSDPGAAFAAQNATSSQPDVVSATTDGSAIAGTHTVVVNSLATTGTLYTLASTAGANTSFLAGGQASGDIQLQVGGANGATRDIAITQGSNDTLSTLASYINTQSAAQNWGVTATVVTDATGSRLALQSQNTGNSGALAVASNTGTTLSFGAPTGGTDAGFTIDGQNFSSASNTVNGAIQGLTLNLASEAPGDPVQVTVASDTSQISGAVNNFISVYNTLVTSINAQYVVDPTGVIPAPPLESNLSLRSVQSSVLGDAAYAITGNSGFVNLESLGINTNNDGTLSLGTSATGRTLAGALAANPAAVQNFFQNASGTGFANVFNSDLSNLTDPTSGPLNVEGAQNNAENQDLTNSITSFEQQLAAEQTSLTQQYDQVNASLQSYPLLLQEITQTLGTLNAGTSGSGSTVASAPTLTGGL